MSVHISLGTTSQRAKPNMTGAGSSTAPRRKGEWLSICWLIFQSIPSSWVRTFTYEFVGDPIQSIVTSSVAGDARSHGKAWGRRENGRTKVTCAIIYQVATPTWFLAWARTNTSTDWNTHFSGLEQGPQHPRSPGLSLGPSSHFLWEANDTLLYMCFEE